MNAQLSVMMFLQFFIWGSWFVTVNLFMKAHGMDAIIYQAYMVGPIAAIVAPFFLGYVADRYFRAERVLAVLHFLGGGCLLAAPWAASKGGAWFIGILGLHTLCYMPTLGLTNTLAFHHIRSQETQFPLIRVFGTLGWIAAGWVISELFSADRADTQFLVAGVAAFGLAAYALTLPATPPAGRGTPVSARAILGLDALRELGDRSFVVFLTASFLICIPLAAYFSYASVFLGDAGVESVAAWMTIGQGSEVLFMFLMPLCFARLGVKWMLGVGMLAWVVRYGLFAAAAPGGVLSVILCGIVLHGICYDFFFVTGQIYTDKRASPAIRGQAQGLLVFVTQGLGMLIGAWIAGTLYGTMVSGEGAAALDGFAWFWSVPAGMAAVVLVAFVVLFREREGVPA